ncbi:hydrogenase maturation protease [Actinomadura macra]|uniref:hydrogenase maturation protease n=1 Tax=Actinomadura macra TaxID=46164 RepID=UPI000A7DD267|nr:hydrogenase maturation protease [Actinomadura macra]
MTGDAPATGDGRAIVGGRSMAAGSRVRLRPRGGADIFDLALDGRSATVERVEEDMEGGLHLVVAVDDDPGRDLGPRNQLGHRFFVRPDEVEPLPEDAPARRVLVAGIGNVFHGDDGFGVEVARRLLERPVPPGVDIIDFGIRGIDLMFALQDGYSTAVLVDAAERGHAPGTVSLVEPGPGGLDGVAVDGHGLDPARVLRLAADSGRVPPKVLLVACEPAGPVTEDTWDMELSAPVAAAVDDAVAMVEELLVEELENEEVDT